MKSWARALPENDQNQVIREIRKEMPTQTITKGLDDSGKEGRSRSKGTIESKISHTPDINLEQGWDQQSKSNQAENNKIRSLSNP